MEAFLGCLGVIVGIALLMLPVVAFILSLANRKRLADLQELQRANDVRTGVLSKQLTDLRHEIAALRASPSSAEAPPPQEAAAPEPEPATPEPVRPPETVPEPQPAPPPVIVPPPTQPEPLHVPMPMPEPEPAPVPAPQPEPVASPPPPPPPRAMPVTPPPPPSRPLAAFGNFDWENLVGVKLFSWIAGIALVLAAIYAFRIAVDKGIFTPPIRAIIGTLTGVTLLVVCEMKAARRYNVTANAMDGAGVAILYSTFFACHSLWHLLDSAVVFGLMIAVTIVAVMLSIRRGSIFIALLGLFGGFLTPFMLSFTEDTPFSLFGYLLLLNAGLAWVAYKKRWPVLTGLSLLFTTIYQWAWVAKFLNADKLPTAIGIFLVFAVFTTVALVLGSRNREKDKSSVFETIALLGAALPLLFAIFAAAVPAYGAHFAMLFGFLLVLDAGLLAIAIGMGREAMLLHGFGALSTVIALATWSATSYTSSAWPSVLAWFAAFVLFYTFADSIAKRVGRELTGFAGAACYAAPALLFVFPFLATGEAATAKPAILFGVLFALLAVLAFAALRTARGLLYYIAAFFAIATEAAWSAKYLTAESLIPALMIYGGFALFFLGVPAIARRMKVWMKPEGAGSVLLLASLAMLLFLAAGPVASLALWGLALLLAVINAGVFAESSSSRHPIVSVTAIILSWAIIGMWWSSVSISSQLVPAMVVVAGFALLITAGNLWSRARAAETSDAFGNALYLGLIGHIFLLFVAAQPALAVPPWPIFAVLGVIDLGIAVAALYARRAALHIAALAASMVVLLTWELTANKGIWPTYAVVAALVVSAFALILIPVARRIGGTDLARSFSGGAVAALFLAEIVTIVASGLQGAPAFPLLVFAHAAALVALLALAIIEGWLGISIGAIVPAALGLFAWRAHGATSGWSIELLFASIIEAIFLLFPFAAARKHRRAIEPSVALVLASAVVFLFLRKSMLNAHFESVIGILPLALAALVCAALVFFLRLEPAGERELGRLALLAGTSLAFITVAIPLQLEKQWITIGWALEAAALAWLYGRIRHRGLLFFSAGLGAAVFVRLVFNPAVFEYHPRGDVRILNWYLYTYLVSALAFFAAALLLRNLADPIGKVRLSKSFTSAGAVLLFLLLNIEIADFYSSGSHLTFNFTASLGQDLTYTLGWAVFAIALLIAGLVWHTRTARVTSILLLLVTIAKCFIHDLGRLGGLYRVGSLVGLAISVAVVALLIQRFVLNPESDRRKEAPAQ